MRAAIGHAIPSWTIPEIMALEWSEFVAEWGEARLLLEGPEKDDG